MAINSNVFLFSKLVVVVSFQRKEIFRKRYFEYNSYRMCMLCLCSLYFASFAKDNKILRHFQLRKLHQKICAL